MNICIKHLGDGPETKLHVKHLNLSCGFYMSDNMVQYKV